MPLFSPLACPARRSPPFEAPPVPPLRTSAARGTPRLRQMPRFASLPTPHTARPIRYSRSLSMSSSRPRRAETPASDETALLHLFARTRGASTSPRTSLFRAVRPSARREVPVSSAIRPSRAGRSAVFLHIYTPPRAGVSGFVSRETTGLPSEPGTHGEHAGEAVALGHAEGGVLAEAHTRALQRQRAALLRQRREVVFLAEVAEDDLPRPIAHQ